MNTETFNKLKAEKRKRIISSAFNEFSNSPYDKVSVFQIAKNAKISRASFYCYFDDKKDIYFFLLKGLKNEMFDNIKKETTTEKFDPFDFILQLFKQFTTFKGTDRQKFIEMMLINLNPTCNNVFVNTESEFRHCDEFSFKNYKSKTTEEIHLIFDMLFYGLCGKLSMYYNNDINIDEITNKFTTIIDLIKYGVMEDTKC